MEGHVDHRHIGWKWARVACLGWRLFRKLQKRFNTFGRGYAWRKVDRRAMQIDNKDPWNFKRGIMYSSRCPPKRECLDSARKVSAKIYRAILSDQSSGQSGVSVAVTCSIFRRT